MGKLILAHALGKSFLRYGFTINQDMLNNERALIEKLCKDKSDITILFNGKRLTARIDHPNERENLYRLMFSTDLVNAFQEAFPEAFTRVPGSRDIEFKEEYSSKMIGFYETDKNLVWEAKEMTDNKQEMIENLRHFVIQCKSDGMKNGCYINYYQGLNVYVSYGMGGRTYIPWMVFSGDGQKASYGIFPVFLYYTDFNVLILAYGVSESKKPEFNWPNSWSYQTIGQYMTSKFGKIKSKPFQKYDESYIYKVYEDTNNINYSAAVDDLQRLIEHYKNVLASNGKRREIPFVADSSHGKIKRETFDVSTFEPDKKTILPKPNSNPELDSALDAYNQELPGFWSAEKYKWVAVENFQKNWNIDAPDFSAMLQEAFRKQGNLLLSGNYFPIGMLANFAQRDQERLRSAFRVLFDESRDIIERIEYFQSEAEQFRQMNAKGWANHFQDLHAISVYLTFRYPEKYYIYKYRELKNAVENLKLNFSFKGKSEASFYTSFLAIMEEIRDRIANHPFIGGQLSHLYSPNCYQDNNFHVTAVDFVFYMGKRYVKDSEQDVDVADAIVENDNPQYWVYSPGEGARKWQECVDEGLMLLGWDEIGDFTRFQNFDEITDELNQQYEGDGKRINDRLAIWQFCHDVKPGDIVFAKRGVSLIVGRGVVQGDYVYDNSRFEYNNYRKIVWTNVGEWDVSFQLPRKTLTGITPFKDMINRLENLFNPNPEIEQIPFDIATLQEKVLSTGLLYSNQLIQRFVCSLLTKPFVILSGLAGSGKTQLALTLARVMSEDATQQICMVPVGADWTNREPLLGFPNALKEGEYMLPESGALQIMMRALHNPGKPYFLILDEMNLSYVERYFADFLSALESHEEIPLWDRQEECESDVPKSIRVPENLFIIGTINVDETTYMFSPKVLDRANVLEFKVADDEMEKFLTRDRDVVVDTHAADGACANMGEDFMRIATNKKLESSELAQESLLNFFRVLKRVNAEFGYRSATEIYRFIAICNLVTELQDDEVLDAAIVQKLLPKLHGSRQKLAAILKELWKLCGSATELDEAEDTVDCKFRLAGDKILRMYKSALKDGFTSFAEA